jgi:hypothetical protein
VSCQDKFYQLSSSKTSFLRIYKLSDEAKSRKSKSIFLFFRIAVVTGGVIWAASRIGQEQRWDIFVEHFRRMNIWVFAGILCIFTFSHAIVGLRWWLLLKTQSIFIGFWPAIKLYFLGWFYNICMPGSVGGDLLRAWYVTKHTDKKFEAALSVFIDRIVGLLSTLVIALFFYAFFLHGRADAVKFKGSSSFLGALYEYKHIVLGLFGLLAVVFCGFLLHERGRIFMRKIWSNIRVNSIKTIEKLRNAVRIYCRNPLVILAVFGLTVFLQIMVITAFWILGINMGINVSIKYYYVFFTLAWVVGTIPISIGGAVVVEGFLVILFTQIAGLEEPAAWAIALSQRAVWIITSLPGAVIHLIGAHLPTGPENKSL